MVEPLIEPLIVSDPLLVVTVQSPVCADGLLNTELTTTWSDVMFVRFNVNGNADIDEILHTKHFTSSCTSDMDEPLSVACPVESVVNR